MENLQENKEALTVIREFNAPRTLVFNAFSEIEALNAWWGPVDFPTTVIKLDFNPGGTFHYKMDRDGHLMYSKFVYKRIDKPNLLEFVSSFTNEKAEIIRAPFLSTWPLEVLNQLTFTENNGKTKMIMKAYPQNASTEETAAFTTMFKNMEQGFTLTFNQLEVYISKINN